ncbi:hypothetical protein EDEG_03046 [Edhazardia aedis USNM 41457]|uniref:Uncharacterized protein n=1 Tax=Edhazardia aedis (strain USNM 41457) TaxID=1003232 RepID=J9D4Q8_EDHAE|nr:hypothetical protein EDEG_03046 [Edhazardia aedis USNM 41457]|eukprot:EJW02534.1 hypothetical protein EDEG_03046 [Edhazardia aedis USNM 41457]
MRVVFTFILFAVDCTNSAHSIYPNHMANNFVSRESVIEITKHESENLTKEIITKGEKIKKTLENLLYQLKDVNKSVKKDYSFNLGIDVIIKNFGEFIEKLRELSKKTTRDILNSNKICV